MTEIHERIKSRREELGMSQDELAEKVGYSSRSTIAKIEAGVNDIPNSKVKLIADALFVSVGYLMGWDDEAPSYYLNEETKQIAQEIYDNKDLRLLFDASRKATPEDLKFAHDMLLRLKKKENYED